MSTVKHRLIVLNDPGRALNHERLLNVILTQYWVNWASKS